MVVLEDPRYRMKVYLDTYITAANLTHDDDATVATYAVMYAYPHYPLEYEFMEDDRTGHKLITDTDTIDLAFLIDKPTSKPIYNYDSTIVYYEESIPVHVQAINQLGLTAEKLLWKAEDELRTVFLTQPYAVGSVHGLSETREHNIKYGATTIYGFSLTKTYLRGST